ncbi:MAG TPA: PAS domain S-box protein [Cytophagaceae bacterium]|nr:PAS domain S-box protein [Cytophagaceae bacterium]
MKHDNKYSDDKRFEKVCDLILKYSTLDFSSRETVSEKGDELDAVIAGLNILGEELQASKKSIRTYEARINSLLEVLLEHTMMNFSKKAIVSEEGDEIDAIAVGLNTLSEELEASRNIEKKHIQRIKESEEQFRMLLEGVKDYAIFIIDTKGYILTWNRGAKEIKGYTGEEIIGKHISVFYTDEEIQHGEPEYNLKMAKETGRHECEGWRIRKDGSRFWADVIFTSLYDDSGNLRGFSKVTRDITERKKSEEKITRLNEELAQNVVKLGIVNKELEAFSYSVSHDLKSPLRAIHGYTKVLSEEYISNKDDEAKMMMNSIMYNAKKMGQLIDDLLAFAGIGKKELKMTNIDMTALAQSAIRELKNAPPYLKANITINPLLPANADYNLIAQVFANLISNAFKYSGTREYPLIEIGSKQEEKENIYYIKDNGVGFDMKYYDKLFGVFQRLHSTAEFEGTGVGLALVKRIILRHNGRVWAEGEIGKGSTFYFSLNKNN